MLPARQGPDTVPAKRFIRTCSIWRALEVVGDSGVLMILQAAWQGIRRFEDLRLATGLLQAKLSDRLKKLIAAGVFEKIAYSQVPLRFEYRLTAKGLDLYWTALMMLRWERRWSTRQVTSRLLLRHRACGHVFEPVPTCLSCCEEIDPRGVAFIEGPGEGWMAPLYSRRRQSRADVEAVEGLMAEISQITGDRWASLILRSVFTGLRRFDEIHRDTAMATNILSGRLDWLTAEGVLTTRSLGEFSHEYRLTQKGLDYYPVLVMLMVWGDRYYVAPEGPPMILRHGADGHRLEPAVTCSCCAKSVHAHDVVFEPEDAAPLPA